MTLPTRVRNDPTTEKLQGDIAPLQALAEGRPHTPFGQSHQTSRRRSYIIDIHVLRPWFLIDAMMSMRTVGRQHLVQVGHTRGLLMSRSWEGKQPAKDSDDVDSVCAHIYLYITQGIKC